MEYRRFADTCVVRVDRGEEVLSALRAVCCCEHIQLAEISGIGAVDYAELGLYDLQSRSFQKQELSMPMELTALLGTVTECGGAHHLHLHATVADAQLHTFGGHAAALRVSGTCELVIRVLGGHVDRQLDAETGLQVFRFDS